MFAKKNAVSKKNNAEAFLLAGTKSPFFRAWFGDWRAYDNNPESDSIIVKYGYGEHLPINKNRRTIRNADTNFDIRIEPDTIDDSLHYATINGDKKTNSSSVGQN